MSYKISERAKTLLNKTQIDPNLVLAIDGFDYRFAASITKVYVKIGDPGLKIDGSWVIGGLIAQDKVLPYMSLGGTTTNITQQIDIDKGAATSTMTVKIRLTDKDQFVTRLISPGFLIKDILYRNATLRLGFVDGAYPEDYIDMFIGKITSIESGPGWIDLTISHPEELKRSEIFPKTETVLVADAEYYSKTIQGLIYYQRGDFNGVVEIRYIIIPFLGATNINVSGSLITVTTDGTDADVKNAIENHPVASDMVRILQQSNAAVSAVPITPLEASDELEVESVVGYYEPQAPLFRTFVRINDEIIEYTGIDTVANKFTGCIRRGLKSIGQKHKIDDTVSSFYKLGDDTSSSNAIDLSLKLMLSNEKEFYVEDLTNLAFYNFGTVDNYPNAFIMKSFDAVRDINVQIGDFATVEDDANPANNFVDGVIEDIEVTDIGTIIYIEGAAFVLSNPSDAIVKFKSKYNVLPDGLQLIPSQVDIKQFLDIKKKYPSAIANYEFYLKDTQNSKDFINKDILLPSAMYPLPRQGRVSCGISSPPLWDGTSKVIDASSVKNPQRLVTTRTTNKNFYNAVVYQYNEDTLEDKTLAKEIQYSQDSVDRIDSPTKAYTIKARGIRPSVQNLQLVRRNCQRYITRYQFAAEALPAEPNYKTAYSMEVGDCIIMGDPDLQMTDSLSGNREYKPRVFEIQNKDFNWRTGAVRLMLVDTNYSSGIRYGVWAPASKIGVASTADKVIIKDSYFSDNEKDKWTPYISRTIRVRSNDYSFSENVKFLGFDPANDHMMLVSPALSIPPTEDMIVDVPNYDDLNLNADSIYKAVHPFWNPTLFVTVAITDQSCEVSAPDAAKLFVDALVRIRNEDYSIDSGNDAVRIKTIVGTTITFTQLDFVPQPGFKIDLIGFVSDQGFPYAWV